MASSGYRHRSGIAASYGSSIFSCFFFSTSLLLVVKNPPANAGDIRDIGSIPGSGGSPGEGHGNPVFWPGEPHGQRSLAGYSQCGCKESDTAEQLSMHAHARHFP